MHCPAEVLTQTFLCTVEERLAIRGLRSPRPVVLVLRSTGAKLVHPRLADNFVAGAAREMSVSSKGGWYFSVHVGLLTTVLQITQQSPRS